MITLNFHGGHKGGHKGGRKGGHKGGRKGGHDGGHKVTRKPSSSCVPASPHIVTHLTMVSSSTSE